MDRKTWLKDRQNGVGGTDIACLAGVGWLTPEQVYEEKVAPEPIDRPPSPVMALGTALEPHNAELYAARTGRRLIAPGLVRATAIPWAFATLDRACCYPVADFGRPAELKYTNFFGDEWGEDGTDQVRDGYIVQATWQVTVIRLRGGPLVEAADLSAIDGWGNHRVYTIPFNDGLAALLLELAEGFWFRVEKRLGLDGWSPLVRDKIAETLAKIHPDTSIALPDEAMLYADSYQLYKANAKQSEGFAEDTKRQLLAMLGTAETGVLPDGRRVRQKEIRVKEHTVAAHTKRDFRILKPKKEKAADEQ